MNRRLLLNIAITLAVVPISMGGAVIVVVSRSEIARSLGINEFWVSLFYALFFLAVSFGGVLIHRLAGSHVSLKFIFFLSSISTGIGALTCYYSNNIVIFALAFFFLIALAGAAPILTILVALSANWLPQRAAISIAIPSIGLLAAFGPWRQMLALVGAPSHWHRGFLLLAVGGAIQLLLVSMLKDFEEAADQPPPSPGLPGPYAVSVKPFAAGLFMSTVGATLLILILREIEASAHIGGYVGLFEIFSGSALFGRVALAVFFDRGFYREAVYLSAGLVILSGLLFLNAEYSTHLPFIAAMSLGCGYAGYLPVVIAYVRRVCRGPRQFNSRILLICGAAGVAFGASIAGAVPQAMGYQSAVAISLLCSIVAIGLLASSGSSIWNKR
jgi:hypothetical protein